MSIIGHGIDLIDLKKVEKHLDSPHNDWLDGVFTESEQDQADPPPNRVAYFSGRYAAKEAVAKALGTGFTDDVAWLDVEILRVESGGVEARLHDGALDVAQSLGITRWLVSISHNATLAMASAIAVGN